MKLQNLRYFIAVAEEEHFGRAAERLGIGQPPLSLQIQRMEKRLKIKLFNRRSRGVELTEGGRMLLKHARHILANVDDAMNDVQLFRRSESKEIIIGYSGGTYFNQDVASCISRFKSSHTELFVKSFLAGSASDIIRKLIEGNIDAAFILPLTDAPDCIELTAVTHEPLTVVLPINHRFARAGDAVSLNTLAREPFIFCERHNIGELFDTVMVACNQAGFSPVYEQYALQLEAIIPMVSAGFGISVVPDSMRNSLHGGVVFLPIKSEEVNTTILLATRNRDSSPVIQHFVTSVRQGNQSGLEEKRKNLNGLTKK